MKDRTMSETAQPTQPAELIVNPTQQAAMAIPQTQLANVPEYAAGFSDDNLMDDIIRPPRVAIIQGTSPSEIKEIGPEGSIYITISNTVIWTPPTKENPHPAPLIITPVFRWPEAICWNPRGVPGLNSMRQREDGSLMRTTNKEDELFRRARSMNSKDREFPCPEAPAGSGKLCKIQEHLNFIVYLRHHEQSALPLLLSFSRTSYKVGRNFNQTIAIRRTPSWLQEYTLETERVKNDEGEWSQFKLGPVVDNATGLMSVVDQEWFNWFTQEHDKHKNAYSYNTLEATYSEQEGTSESTETQNAAKRF